MPISTRRSARSSPQQQRQHRATTQSEDDGWAEDGTDIPDTISLTDTISPRRIPRLATTTAADPNTIASGAARHGAGRRRRTSHGGRRVSRRVVVASPSPAPIASTERADAAFERIATAKEEVAKSAKFAALLTHQGQLLPHQQRALRAITDAYLGELSATSPITIDNLDASPARPQHELLPDTDDDEGSHGEEGL